MQTFKAYLTEKFYGHYKERLSYPVPKEELHEIYVNPTKNEIVKAKFKELGIILLDDGNAYVFDGWKLLHRQCLERIQDEGYIQAELRAEIDTSGIITKIWESGLTLRKINYQKTLDSMKKSKWLNAYPNKDHVVDKFIDHIDNKLQNW